MYNLYIWGSCFVAQAGLELSVLLPQPLKCWDYKCMQPCTTVRCILPQFFNPVNDNLPPPSWCTWLWGRKVRTHSGKWWKRLVFPLPHKHLTLKEYPENFQKYTFPGLSWEIWSGAQESRFWKAFSMIRQSKSNSQQPNPVLAKFTQLCKAPRVLKPKVLDPGPIPGGPQVRSSYLLLYTK
jgi:hypothetical protein